MKDTIKNMELLLVRINKAVFGKRGTTGELRSLISSYSSLCKSLAQEDNCNDVVANLSLQIPQLDRIKRNIKNEKLPSIINSGSYNHVEVQRFTQILELLDSTILSASNFMDNDDVLSSANTFLVDELLETSIKTGTLVTFYDESYRRVGKTTALIKKACELDAVLIVSTSSEAEVVRESAKALGLNPYVTTAKNAFHSPYHIDNKLQSVGYLVDELVSKDDLHLLTQQGYKLLGGFKRIVI